MEQIHIVTATNDIYAKPLGVMINSLLSNTAKKSNVIFYVIESGLSNKNKLKLEKVVVTGKANIKFLSIDKSLFDGLKERDHITKETYYRLAIPALLSKEITKVLYLDSDIIVKEDISEIWNTNIDDYYLAAVEKKNLSNKRKKALGIPKKSSYFNAGVLLINLKKWRENKISSRILNYCRKNSSNIRFCSQDPMNAILHDKWLKLNRKWNFITAHVKRYPNTKPAIIHYTGSKKPWDHGHGYQHDYNYYLKSTIWANDQMEGGLSNDFSNYMQNKT